MTLEQPRYITHFKTALLGAAWAATLVAAWLRVFALSYHDRESLLHLLTLVMAGYPFALLILPNRMRPWLLLPAVWCLALGVACSDDMGGHFLTGAFLVMAALWATVLGVLSAFLKLTRAASTQPMPSALSPTRSAAQWAGRTVLLLVPTLWLGAELSRLAEFQRVTAPFAQSGMRVYRSGSDISLQCGDHSFGDDQLAQLQNELETLPDLKILNLSFTATGDAGLTHLCGLRDLEYLSLYGTKVTDEGVQKLEGMRQLRELNLHETSVTAAGVATLREKLPNCRVDH